MAARGSDGCRCSGQPSARHLETAGRSVYGLLPAREEGRKPRIPSVPWKGWWDSFAFREFDGISFDGRRLRFKGMPGSLDLHVHRPLPEPARFRSCTFRRDTKGWKVGFVVDVAAGAPTSGRRRVGVDLGISTFAALSDGGFIPSLKAARRAARRLRVAQRSLARKRRGSKTGRKARTQVARCYAATTRARSDHLHQATARLTRDYDLIAIEALNVGGLARSALARDVQDASWSRFRSMLRYKAERAGVQIFEVDPRNTSQDCSGCGMRASKGLHERRHDCSRCGLSIDRDLNAARNILARAGVGPGLHNVAGYGKRAGGNISLTDGELLSRRSN